MNENKAHQWLVVHLYYAELLDEFLVQAVKPFLNTVLKTGIASQYYYSRQRVRGTHIKLFIKGEEHILETILKPNLKEHFENYYERYPSERVEPQYSKDFPAKYRWHPNNTVLFYSYLNDACNDPDTELQCIADQQYQESSELILEILSKRKITPTYEWLIIKALEIHLTFIHAIGFDIDDSIQFFQAQYDYLIPYAFPDTDKSINETLKKNINLKHLNIYQKTYNNQRDSIIFPVYEIWKRMTSSNLENEDMLNWISQNKKIKEEMEKAFLEAYNQKEEQTKHYKKVSLWTYYQMFFSNTNNRLGITRKDESLIAFFLINALQEIKETISEQTAIV